MMMAENLPSPPPLSDEALRVRRRRSVAIALSLGALCVIFYAVSMAKVLG